jgi:hypothetical protein
VKQLQRLAYPVVLVYLWVMMLLLGSIVLETFLVYPNVFHDPPASLELGMRFMAVRGPSDFFPPLGLPSWVTGVGALALAWPVRAARGWILFSLAMIVGEGAASVLFFWPRNEILFVEGQAVHSAEALRRVAQEFQALHWSRLAFNAAAAVAIFVGFLRFYRHRLLSRASPSPSTRAAQRAGSAVRPTLSPQSQ